MTADDDELSATFQALADPTRRAILAHLAQGEATVLELAEPFQLSLPAVSKHLKVLQKAGLISQGRRAQWRPCRLEPARLKDVSEWIEHTAPSGNNASIVWTPICAGSRLRTPTMFDIPNPNRRSFLRPWLTL